MYIHAEIIYIYKYICVYLSYNFYNVHFYSFNHTLEKCNRVFKKYEVFQLIITPRIWPLISRLPLKLLCISCLK